MMPPDRGIAWEKTLGTSGNAETTYEKSCLGPSPWLQRALTLKLLENTVWPVVPRTTHARRLGNRVAFEQTETDSLEQITELLGVFDPELFDHRGQLRRLEPFELGYETPAARLAAIVAPTP